VPYDVPRLSFPSQFKLFYVFVYLSHSYQFVSVSITVTTTGNYFIKRKVLVWLIVSEVSVHDSVAPILWACDWWHIVVVALGRTHYSLHV
jgi:hypothetical protein